MLQHSLSNVNNKQSEEAHWVLLFIDRNKVEYFVSFGVECITQEVLIIKTKSITNASFTPCLEYKMIIRLCVYFTVSLY